MKKQSIITILLTVLMNMVGAKVFAYDIAVENADGVTIYYNYINDGKELEVTCYSMGNSLAGPWSTYAGNVIIPSEVTYVNRTRSVTSIGYSAFISCRNLTSILIPNSVKSIGNLAFFECDELTSVTIPNSVTSIGGSAFAGCTRITSVTIPNGVTSISGYTFWLCSGLSSVVIPNSVTSIGESAFSGCESLTSVTIPSSVTSIGEYAFAGCTSLSSVHISDLRLWCGIAFADSGSNPLTYAHHLYLNGVEVKDLVIPDSFTSIGNFVFSGCEGLTSVKINNAQIIGDYAFASCTGFPSIVIPEGVIQIGNNAFNNCTGLSSIVIPNGVRTIGSGAFYACTGLLFVTLPNSLTSIGDLAFEGADIPTITSYLENPFSICGKDNSNKIFSTNTFNNATLYVPVGTIDKYKSTNGWKDFLFIEEGTGPDGGGDTPSTSDEEKTKKRTIHVSIPGTLSELISMDEKYQIEELTLTGELNGTDFRLIRDMAGIGWDGGEYYFRRPRTTSGNLISLDLAGAKIVQGGNSYLELTDISPARPLTRTGISYCYYTEDNSITSRLFSETKLTSIIIPNSVTSIGSYAFEYCRGLVSIEIPSSVASIVGSLFEFCSGLASIKVESGNQYYDSRNNCNAIIEKSTNTLIAGCKNTIIPNSVTSIGNNAFYGCGGLISITIPNSVTSIGDYAFYNCSDLTIIVSEIENPFEIDEYVFGGISTDTQLIVPKGTKAAYLATEGWNKFANIVEAGEDMAEVDGVNYIVEGETAVASMGVDVKDEVKIEESVEIDGKTYIVTAIAAGAFQGNVEITSVVIPNSVEAIGESAFEDCTGIISIVIGKAIREIARRAFADFLIDAGTRADGNGIDVYCYAEEVPNTAEDAFDGTPTEKSTLHVSASAIEKYRAAWPWSDFKEIVALDEDDPDGIRGVKQDDCIGEYYDLTGRRVHNPQKGLYIRDSKKVVVK